MKEKDKLLISEDGCVGANFKHPYNRKAMREVIATFSGINDCGRLLNIIEEARDKLLPFDRLDVKTKEIGNSSPIKIAVFSVIEYTVTSKDYGITVVVRTDETECRSSYRNVEIAKDMIFKELLRRYYVG